LEAGVPCPRTRIGRGQLGREQSTGRADERGGRGANRTLFCRGRRHVGARAGTGPAAGTATAAGDSAPFIPATLLDGRFRGRAKERRRTRSTYLLFSCCFRSVVREQERVVSAGESSRRCVANQSGCSERARVACVDLCCSFCVSVFWRAADGRRGVFGLGAGEEERWQVLTLWPLPARAARGPSSPRGRPWNRSTRQLRARERAAGRAPGCADADLKATQRLEQEGRTDLLAPLECRRASRLPNGEGKRTLLSLVADCRWGCGGSDAAGAECWGGGVGGGPTGARG